METPKIPATVAILTRNSGASIAEALTSVQEFSEILVCDGGSTDDTRIIAQSYGARVLEQDTSALDGDGRLANWSIVRNQCLEASTFKWHFFLDSDEVLGADALHRIRAIVELDVPAAYMVDRMYQLGTQMIDCSIAYPNRQMRFFHKDVVTTFRKPVHERIDMREGVTAQILGGSIIVPVDTNAAARKRKGARYIHLELSRFSVVTVRLVVSIAAMTMRVSLLYLLRLVRIAVACKGKRMPLTIELESFRYLWSLLLQAILRIRSL